MASVLPPARDPMEIPPNLKQDAEAGHCFDRADYLWVAQYQQNLTAVEGNMIKAAWLRVAPEELMGQQREIIVPVVPTRSSSGGVGDRETVPRNELVSVQLACRSRPSTDLRCIVGHVFQYQPKRMPAYPGCPTGDVASLGRLDDLGRNKRGRNGPVLASCFQDLARSTRP